MYARIQFEESANIEVGDKVWYPDGDGWNHGQVISVTNGDISIEDVYESYTKDQLHPFVFVDPKYSKADVHDHSFVCKIEHHKS